MQPFQRATRRSVSGAAAVALLAVGLVWVPQPTAGATGRQHWVIHELGGGATASSAAAGNARGVVVGEVMLSRQGSHQAVRWVNGRRELLRPAGRSATAIDERGWIAGTSTSGAVVWHDGRRVLLGTLGGAFGDPNFYTYEPLGFDAHGRIFGMAEPQFSDGIRRAFVWESGRMTAVGSGRSWIAAVGRDATVGTIERGKRANAFIWRDGRRIDLPSPAGAVAAHAAAVNRRNEVVGWAEFGDLATPRAVVWRDGKPAFLPVPAGALMSRANAIGDDGEIVGQYDRGVAGNTPVLWRGSRRVVLSTRRGCSWDAAIGSDGLVLLQATCLAGSAESRTAYVWQNGTLVRLPGLGGSTSAEAANGHGAIVGSAELRSGQGYEHAVVWTSSG